MATKASKTSSSKTTVRSSAKSVSETINRPTSVFAKSDPWRTYVATLEFTGRLVGGSPSDPKLVESWMAKNLGLTDEEDIKRYTRRHLMEVQGLDPDTMSEEAIEAALADAANEKKAQVFKQLPESGFPYIEGRQVKAMLKEAVAIAFPRGEVKWGSYKNKTGVTTGGKEPRSYFAERAFVPERPIVVAEKVDGIELAVGHIKDWKGETRSTLGYFEYVETPTLMIEVQALDDCFSESEWSRIWSAAERQGLGARRSQGAGQFVCTAWEAI